MSMEGDMEWGGEGALFIEATETKQIRVTSVSKGLARPKKITLLSLLGDHVGGCTAPFHKLYNRNRQYH